LCKSRFFQTSRFRISARNRGSSAIEPTGRVVPIAQETGAKNQQKMGNRLAEKAETPSSKMAIARGKCMMLQKSGTKNGQKMAKEHPETPKESVKKAIARKRASLLVAKEQNELVPAINRSQATGNRTSGNRARSNNPLAAAFCTSATLTQRQKLSRARNVRSLCGE
jgi:hypothetical protein